jgi:hypothetical protein
MIQKVIWVFDLQQTRQCQLAMHFSHGLKLIAQI